MLLNRLFLIFFLTLFVQSAWAQKVKTQKPNVIFILVDDQGFGDIGAFYQKERAKEGKPFERTPHLDKMAEEGAMFMQQYASSPVCAPSRASLLTGVSQGHANVRDNQFDKALEDNYSMASTLKELGYSTAAIGKWGLQGADQWDKNGDEWPARPSERSFDYFLGYMRHIDGHEHYPKEGPYGGQKEVWLNNEVITEKLDKTYTADLWTAAAKNWITDHQKENDDSPFFMYLAYDTPHAILELPTQKYPEGGGLEGGIQWIGEDGNFINTASGEIDSYIHPDYANATYKPDTINSEIPWPETYKRFATANRRIDYAVGDLIQLLKDLKIDDNTIIVYTSDNGVSAETYLGDWQAEEERHLGTFFGSYGPFDGIKRDTWEGGLRMPTIARWPSHIKPGTVIEEPNTHYDWAPTFLEAAGATAPARMDGVSLLSSLTGDGEQLNSKIYIEYYSNSKTPSYKDFTPEHQGRTRKHMQNIRLGNYMGVRYNIQSASDDFEIYDVKKDPQQTTDLAPIDQTITFEESGDISKSETKQMTMDELQEYMKQSALQSRIAALDISRPYDNTLIPPTNIDEEQIVQGINWYFYKGDFPWIPQVNTLEADASGNIEEIIKVDTGNEDGILVYSGFISVPLDGEYTFSLNSNSQAFLRIHDMQAIDADYNFSKSKEYKRTLLLKTGLHAFTLYYHKKADLKQDIDFEWTSSGLSKQKIHKFVLFSKPEK